MIRGLLKRCKYCYSVIYRIQKTSLPGSWYSSYYLPVKSMLDELLRHDLEFISIQSLLRLLTKDLVNLLYELHLATPGFMACSSILWTSMLAVGKVSYVSYYQLDNLEIRSQLGIFENPICRWHFNSPFNSNFLVYIDIIW